jgi:inner membrane protein
MDILTHILSGTAAATVAASLSGKDISRKGVIVVLGAVGAVLPDLDTVSRWSGFDGTVGKWLGTGENGRDIYFANHWYSHHNAAHSILAALLAALALAGVMYLWHRLFAKKKKGGPAYLKGVAVYGVALFLGYLMHLLGDLPTPPSTWGGIKLFWPLGVTVGGWGRIWWWNNYDLFLIIYVCCLVNVVALLACRPKGRCMKVLPAVVFALALFAAVYQIDHRPVSFASDTKKSHEQLEADSLRVQKGILGNTLYGLMRDMDGVLARHGIIF